MPNAELRGILALLDLSLSEWSAAAGLSRSLLSRAVNGHRRLSPEAYARLLGVLHERMAQRIFTNMREAGDSGKPPASDRLVRANEQDARVEA